jgi:hypothetical protein
MCCLPATLANSLMEAGQSPDLANMAERVLVCRKVVARNLCVYRTCKEEKRYRIEGLISLMDGKHGGAVRLFNRIIFASWSARKAPHSST